MAAKWRQFMILMPKQSWITLDGSRSILKRHTKNILMEQIHTVLMKEALA